jgi:hypothetical protein
MASWFWRELLRHQQPSGTNLAFLSAHINLCCVGVSVGLGVRCVSRWVPVCLDICSQLVINYTFFPPQNTAVVLFDFWPWSDSLSWSMAPQGSIWHTVAWQ